MSEPDKPPTPDRLAALLEEGDHEGAVGCLGRLGAADAETRKRALRVVRDVAGEPSASSEELAGALSTFLTDEDRAVRLTTAKLFVTLGQSKPGAVLPAVSSLADRLADDEEFYYVRARSAEALGYVALESPGAVSDPGILADFRIGLSFDGPEVTEKLAKALECVALGDPDRLRHRLSSLVAHLDDGNALVRYHLCTVLVAVGCAHPAKLTDARAALAERLTDESPYVRGRAAEALGLLSRSGSDDAVPAVDGVDPGEDEAQAFVTERVQFARDRGDDRYEGVGTVESIRRGTDEIVEAITSPDGDEACPHCGLELPDAGPPTCPRCGAPR
jgi:HEAT repeat protein